VDAIVVDELQKHYGRVRALEGVTFAVRAGEVFGLLGPNGAGKSTTVKVLATLTQPNAGRAEVAGHDVVRDPNAVRRAIGYVPQSSGVDRDATGRENLMLQGRVQGMGGRVLEARVDELLDLLGLAGAADRVVRGYSGGMKRRLDVGLGLVHRPQVLFLDEPTTGLDPRTRGQMWDTIRDLIRDGATVVLTTQYLDEADQLADRVAVIDRGRKVAQGTPDELKSQVGSSTLQLRMLDPEHTGEAADLVRRVLGEEPVLTPEAGGINVALTDANRAADVLIGLREHDLLISSATVQKPTLDEVFMALTGHAAEDVQPEPEMEPVR